jgi:hypothetical protein
MIATIDGIPILYGRIVGRQIHVFCPDCRRKHFHGWPNLNETEPSHRQAHCTDEGGTKSVYRDKGYYVAPEPK